MVGPWPFRPYTFIALTKTFGPLWVRCDVCRRYARMQVGELLDVDYRSEDVQLLRVRRPRLALRR